MHSVLFKDRHHNEQWLSTSSAASSTARPLASGTWARSPPHGAPAAAASTSPSATAPTSSRPTL
eukprot:5420772-Prorocentrum_lima.AAC.1